MAILSDFLLTGIVLANGGVHPSRTARVNICFGSLS